MTPGRRPSLGNRAVRSGPPRRTDHLELIAQARQARCPGVAGVVPASAAPVHGFTRALVLHGTAEAIARPAPLS
jgi:hypothetical protein